MVNVSGMLRSTLRLIDKCSESEQSCTSNFWHIISEKFVKLLMRVISYASPLSNSKILPDLQTSKKWFFNTPNILVYDNGHYKDMVQVVTVNSFCTECSNHRDNHLLSHFWERRTICMYAPYSQPLTCLQNRPIFSPVVKQYMFLIMIISAKYPQITRLIIWCQRQDCFYAYLADTTRIRNTSKEFPGDITIITVMLLSGKISHWPDRDIDSTRISVYDQIYTPSVASI